MQAVSLYIGTIICCEMVTIAAKGGTAIPEELYLQHGSLGLFMYTLFLGVSGGILWKDLVSPLDEFCGPGRSHYQSHAVAHLYPLWVCHWASRLDDDLAGSRYVEAAAAVRLGAVLGERIGA